MLRHCDNTIGTSPSFLQSVLAGSVEADISDLHVEVKELEKNIQHLTVDVHEDLTGRYLNFDKFEQRDGDYLQMAQRYMEELENISSRIRDGQIKTDVEDSAVELQNLQSALSQAKTLLSVIYQFLSIDCALQTVKTSMKQMKYLEAASCHSKIPPMFEKSQNQLYQDLFDGLKKQFFIQRQRLSTHLDSLWTETLSWNAGGQSLSCKTKTVSLKMLKSQEMDTFDILTALFYVDSLESTLSMFGTSLLQVVLMPILTAVTSVKVKDTKEHRLLVVTISLTKEKPALTMVAANLKIVFDFLSELMNIDLGPSGACLNMLGAFISHDFSKMLLKECLIISSKVDEEDDFRQGLEELNELVEYISDTGFLHSDNLAMNVTKLTKLAVKNVAFLESATYLEKARQLLKKDIKETVLLEEGFQCFVRDGRSEGTMVTSVEAVEHTSYAFPTCRVSKGIIELVKLFREIIEVRIPSQEEESTEPAYHFFETARSVLEMYAAIGTMRCRHAEAALPSEIALFHNNSMFLAQNLSHLGFANDVEKYTEGCKLISVDLIQCIRAMAVKSLLDCLKTQRNIIVEKTRSFDVEQLKTSVTTLEQTVKDCLLLLEDLRFAWKSVLPDNVYMKAMGGIINSWLEELIKVLSSAGTISGSIGRDIKVLYKVVADNVLTLLEGSTDVGSHVFFWNKFEKLVESRFLVETF